MTTKKEASYVERAREARAAWDAGNFEGARQIYEDLITRDPATRLYNKVMFYDELSSAITLARKQSEPLGVVVLDIDNFKRINDARGHPFGDDVIQYVANILRTAPNPIRTTDIAGRLGGEEFGLIAPMTDEQGIAYLGHKIVEAVNKNPLPSALNGLESLSVSAGATVLRPEDSAETFLKRADQGLYVAKISGKNLCYVVKERETVNV